MKKLTIILFFLFAGLIMAQGKSNILDVKVKDIDGNNVNLSKYKGQVLLIVNVASKCGYTPQYKELEAIYKKYKDQGFTVLGFPSNDFKQQEPGTNEEIKSFCTENYGVTFPLFDKVKVLGSEKTELYKRLTNNKVTGNDEINWNFEKFIIDKKGEVVARFAPNITPTSPTVVEAIEKELKNKDL